MTRWLIVLALLCLSAAACRNAPAAAREELRREVEVVNPEERDALRTRLRALMLGDANRPAELDPHLRASAAQGLGELGEPADAGALLDGLMGTLDDDNAQVRMECAIALGKLSYGDASDERRQNVVTRLRDRAATDRDDGGRLLERDYMVRLAMVNSLARIGGRSSAAAVLDVARRLAADLEGDAAVRADIADKGLLDRCLESLRGLAGVSREEADANRAQSDELAPHLSWWASRVARMTEN